MCDISFRGRATRNVSGFLTFFITPSPYHWTLKMATAMFVEALENLKRRRRSSPKAEVTHT
jgi:hypothetical protein